ncbi:hypothetical protein BKP45_10665 [Anaerobacillus alkalidiazotrophicus]|uniref:Uncharacterized protein n=1 Tax=Anaerobacillus alkalidiazotrophicus TaxID=472963 RepID=A0A1S2M093_9BACI|nr:hypothetical protein [Anaerobacillus alkalidiazotrophicus]OIJ18056.1 hypothetical protein BKP45_16380 [Anaerobacillus alkalidiazotrophicus]OIJ19535.1 hypothetical protein BKP45_10665 [Anaerobacillus alkalidiazotrophicus]
MKYMPYYMSLLGFFLTLIFLAIIGKVLNIDWLILLYDFREISNGGIVEARISWITIILATIVSYLSWKLGKKKFQDDKLSS